MKKLIVNADDLGLSKGVNKGIIKGFRQGIVTSATALVNMPSWSHAAQMVSRFPALGVGLHFNISLGHPVTAPELVPSLVDGCGQFAGDDNSLRAADSSDIARELFCQYNRLIYSGIKPTHIDSYNNVHSLDNVLPVVLSFAAGHGLPVRLVPRARGSYVSSGTPTTRELIMDFWDRGANRQNFERLLSECCSETVELKCHPGMMDDDLEHFSAYTWQRERELAVVCAFSKEEFPQLFGYQLMPYSGLRQTVS